MPVVRHALCATGRAVHACCFGEAAEQVLIKKQIIYFIIN